MEQFVKLGSDMASLWSKYGGTYMGGIWRTLVLASVGTAIGCLIGFLCGIVQTIPVSRNDSVVKKVLLRIVQVILRIYVEVFRGTPMILQAVFIFYGLPYFTNNSIQFDGKWLVSILVVSINTGAYMTESMRGGIISVDPGQTEGAMAIGMTHFQTMTSNFIINVKDTSVMFIIGFTDFFAVHKSVVGATFTYFPSAAIEMIGYLTMTLLASWLLRFLEKRMDGKSDYELVAVDQLTLPAGVYHVNAKKSEKDMNPDERAALQKDAQSRIEDRSGKEAR